MTDYLTTTYERNEQGQLVEHKARVELQPGLFAMEASDDMGRHYATNGMRWIDIEDAKTWAWDLAMRWFGCTNIRIRACDEAGDPTGDTLYQTL